MLLEIIDLDLIECEVIDLSRSFFLNLLQFFAFNFSAFFINYREGQTFLRLVKFGSKFIFKFFGDRFSSFKKLYGATNSDFDCEEKWNNLANLDTF